MASQRLAKASVIMALGTIVSRITGFARMLLLIAVLGTALNADIFELANSVPNSLYILVAGGVFNVVFVPQLVKAMKEHEDGGEAFAQRLVTLGLVVLIGGTLVLMAAIPLIIRIVFDGTLFSAGFERQYDSALLLMCLTMPQVFFYGLFVLLGQLLNSRERFGPMMWAPIANNLVALCILSLYAFMFGPAQAPANDGFSTNEALLLGVGSTAGIVVQSLILIPFLRQIDFRFRLRFDFRGNGLGHIFNLGAWTLALIAITQMTYFAVARMGSAATLQGKREGVAAAGNTVYALGHLISQVPHGIITVSVATAMIPTLAGLAAEAKYAVFSRQLGMTLRFVALFIVPFATLIACLGTPLGNLVGSLSASSENTIAIGTTITAFSLVTVGFSLHYVVLRGFYSLEDTRTPFLIQLVIATVNISTAFTLTRFVDPLWVSTALALALGPAYLAGLVVAVVIISRRTAPLFDREMLVFFAKLLGVSVVGAALVLMSRFAWDRGSLPDGSLWAFVLQLCVFGVIGLLSMIAALVAFRVQETRQLLSLLGRRRRTS